MSTTRGGNIPPVPQVQNLTTPEKQAQFPSDMASNLLFSRLPQVSLDLVSSTTGADMREKRSPGGEDASMQHIPTEECGTNNGPHEHHHMLYIRAPTIATPK